MRQYHIQLEPGEVGSYVLMPGDPGRCERIAAHFDSPKHIRSNREFTSYTGTLDGVDVSVVSTGIGGPSTAIAAEELYAIGVRTMIRIGSCGAIATSLKMGDAVIVSGAIRNEGTSHQYVPAEFPAVSNFEVLKSLDFSAKQLGVRHSVGIVQCSDSFYSETSPDTVPLEHEIKMRWEAWKRAGCIAAEMESSTLFIVGAVRNFRAGAVMAVVNTAQGGEDSMPSPEQLPIDTAIEVCIGGIRELIALDASQTSS